ncbi:MAG: glycoside hydrolase family 18 protein [Candidatus Hydrogenedentota bacterium]|nr:MAG: glycoside hydrolase family 18 protein [Candidatus Hydrogenedentota bacterium]
MKVQETDFAGSRSRSPSKRLFPLHSLSATQLRRPWQLVVLGACFATLTPVGATTTVSASTAQPQTDPQSVNRPTAGGRPPIVLGYYPSWPCGLEPAQIRYENFTHLCHAFVTATPDGKLKTDGNLPSRELTSRAHAAGVKVLLSVGGADSGKYMGPIATSETLRTQFARALVGMVREYGYDGIDLDWEFPTNPTEKEAFTQLARELRELLGLSSQGTNLLTSAQVGVPDVVQNVDMQALRGVMDWVAIMTYDMHGPWSNHAGYNAAFRTAKGDREGCTSRSLVAQMATWRDVGGWPPERLLVGIPCYGRGFPVRRWHDPMPPNTKPARPYLAYKDILPLLEQGWVRHFDNYAMIPWLERPGGGELLSYDDVESVQHKTRWARQNGFGGVFFWEISQDWIGGRNILIEAARKAWETNSREP